jgi:DNA-binding transcriptional LysR family regulator
MLGVDLNDVAIFVRVLERGSFADAARELQVPTSTVSRTIARLEETLGTRLIHRTTRALRPTSEGSALYADAAGAVVALEQATRAVSERQQEIAGTLRVTAPNDMVAMFLSDAVLFFTERHPQVQIDLVLTPRVVDLVGEGFDCALRAGVLRDSTLIARKIADLEARLFAAPAYIAKYGTPRTTADLDHHRCVLFRGRNGETEWLLSSGDSEDVRVRVTGNICGDDLAFVRAATLGGGGIGLLPALLCAKDVASGRLVEVLPTYESRGSALYFVHASAKHVPAKIGAFRDCVLSTFQRWKAELGRVALRA